MTRDEEVFARARPWLGWLVISGGIPATRPDVQSISERLLKTVDPSLAPVWIDPEGEPAPGLEDMIEDMELLLSAPIERLEPGDDMPGAEIEVGLILIVGRNLDRWLETLGSTPAGDWVADRLDAGVVVFAGAAAAAVLGDRIFPDGADSPGCPGLGWLPGAVLLPGVSDPVDYPEVREYLTKTDHSYALGLQEGTAVAIGPQGQVEVWTGEPPRIVLGRGWIRDE